MVDSVILQERLKDAEAAYHSLVVGTAARVFVDQNGERIEYVSANRAALAGYIVELKRLLGESGNGGPLSIWL